MKASQKIKVVLAGQPNCGKTTMFNALTGATARVGNYPGITVERLEGRCKGPDDREIEIIDLPGVYSLTSYSPEEVVTRSVIIEERPDIAVCMVDASALERGLYLPVQFLELGVPLIIALNMMDEAGKKNIFIDCDRLEKLLGVKVIPCVARRRLGCEQLLAAIVEQGKTTAPWKPREISYGADIDTALIEMVKLIEENSFLTDKYPARFLALKYIEADEQIIAAGTADTPHISARLEDKVKKLSIHTERTLNAYPEALIADYRYGYINSLLRQRVIRRENITRYDISDKMDKVLTHRFLGPLIMFAILYLLFDLTFRLGSWPQELVGDFFEYLAFLVTSNMADSMFRSLLVNGIIAGVGGVLGFAPLILIMFAMLCFLEDFGYMARMAYMLDRVFRIFGLHGASVMPLIISGGIPGGCAVPGVMAARTLKSPRERLATILVAPFMVCGAKVTAYVMIVAAFFSKSQAPVVMFCLTLTAWAFSLLGARVLRWTIIKGESTPFVMELPPYRLPTLYGIYTHTIDRVWQFIKKAGTVILLFSVVMWAMMSFPQMPETRKLEFKARQHAVNAELNKASKEKQIILRQKLKYISAEEAQLALKSSFAGILGTGLTGVTRYAGFPWQMNVALIGGFAAKEVMVSTLATAYSLGRADLDDTVNDNENRFKTITTKIKNDPAFQSPAAKLSILLFMLLYAPCLVTVVAIARESSWKWACFSLFSSLIFAFVLSVAVYQLGTYLWC